MDLQVEAKRSRKIDETSILQQTAFWSDVKRKQGLDSRAFDIKASGEEVYSYATPHKCVRDDLLILFQNIGKGYQIGYVPYGPTMRPNEESRGIFLEALSESLRPFLPKACIVLRYDLLWQSPWAKETDYFDSWGNWQGPPAKASQEIRLNFETDQWNLKKANTNILPSDTLFIDLTKDKSVLLQEMKPKTRYNVRLATRNGVVVRSGGVTDLDTWYELYKQTCKRNGMFLQPLDYFVAVLTATMNNVVSPAEVDLLIAEASGTPLAAMFLVLSGKRATYLYGASSSTNRHLMSTYALQWDAMERAKERGCKEYDMFGVSPNPDPSHPLYGLYRFKTGFGGALFHRMGCWDYPLDGKTYEAYRTSEMAGAGSVLG
jgi:lipid II:glycine glycyltransferase (peptidoglycan interpeptide bridge formation enzyme)